MIQKKSLNSPDDTMNFEKIKIDVSTVGDITFMRATWEPGAQWSKHIKPIAKTESCQKHHSICFISGRLRVRMDDGTENEFGPGDVGEVHPGHDAWVVGDETVQFIDIAVKQ